MAVRIKDLTGTDTFATDDKMVVDGDTNGPRSFPGSSATPGAYIGINSAGVLDVMDRGHNGRTILEAGSVTDASAEFLSGATFELDPTNPRHYNIQIGDASTPLTANMVVDLVPDSEDWPVNCSVTVIKGDTSAYTVTVSGFDADGEGTHTLSAYRESVRCVYQTTDSDNGPGALGQKFARHSIVYRSALNIAASNATSGLVADNVQEQLDELAAASGGSGLSSVTNEEGRLALSVDGGVATIGDAYIAHQSDLDDGDLTLSFVETPLIDPGSTSADVTCNLSFGTDAGGEHIVCVMPLDLTGTITLRSADYATGGLVDGQASITAPGSGFFTVERLPGSTKHFQTSLVPAPTFTGSATFDAAIYEAVAEDDITGSATVDLSAGQHQRLTLTGNVTALALSNRPPDGYSQTVLIDFIQDGTGSRTLAWFSGALFPDGGSISITSDADAMTSVSVTVVGSAGDIIVRSAGYDIKAP